jgi:FkbM family methyltransferase
MTRAGLRSRWHDAVARFGVVRRGLPHGCDPQLDVDRRLSRTPIELVFDVGANRGQSAKRFRRWYPSATIHCFEPAASTFALLEQAVAAWPRVHTHCCALDAAPGMAWMEAGVTDDRSQLRREEGVGECVQVETLDLVCARLGVTRIDYLKTDTEGRDLDVLRGGADILGRGSVAIVEVEAGMHPGNHFHARAGAIGAYLEERDYRLFGVYEQTLEWPTADAHLRRANLVFVSAETIRRNHWPVSQTIHTGRAQVS